MSLTSKEALQNFTRFRNDPVAFLTECVYTLDQVDKSNPIKLFPIDYEYMKLYVKVWQKYPLIAVPKSRRMTMSWVNIALFLWDTIFNQGRYQAFVSKKEEDTKELLSKAEHIFDHIPEDKIPRAMLPVKKTKSQPPVLEFPEIKSKIQGFPMGADQLRQFTFSGIFGDECAFWPEAQKFYSASFPTLEGGGRMSLVSSPAPGFFKKLVFDTIKKDVDLSMKPKSAKTPMQGVTMWVNEDNKFLVMELHYTANPNKRSKTYQKSIESSMPRRDYLQEYELNWDSFEGLAVYEDFNRNIHLTIKDLEPLPGLPLLIGWDFGLTPAAIIGQLQEDQLVILKEVIGKNISIDLFAPRVMREITSMWPNWNDQEKHFRHFVDPSGAFRVGTDGNTCVNEMYDQGLRNIDATQSNDIVPRRQAVEHFLIKHDRKGPGIILNEETSPVLTKGFLGGYMYPESYGEIEPDKLKPLKNSFSHPHDALQYLCRGVIDFRAEQDVNIPSPNYAFTSRREGSQTTKTGAKKYGY